MQMYRWIQSLFQAQTQVLSNALPELSLQKMTQELQQSPYLQKNVLNQRFATTQGFSVLFRDPLKPLLDVPALQAFLNLLDLQPYNFFYLNVLVLQASSKVERHIDHSIRGYGSELPFPKRVSILYLQIPETMQGGRLLLYNQRDKMIAKIQPESGLLVHLKGSQKHAVEAILETSQARVSLVCEQYSLGAEQLNSLPSYALKTTAGFDAFLQNQLGQADEPA